MSFSLALIYGVTLRSILAQITASLTGSFSRLPGIEGRQSYQFVVVGSGLEFDERGEHELRGIEGRWRLLALSFERNAH